MIKLYLITGFLGAGKTTMLKNFINIVRDHRVSVIINEFGKQGIDGSLVKNIGVYVDEISNGSIFCSCRLDKFETVLQQHIKLNPNTIIVEASGLSDPSSVKKVLAQFPQIEYAGCICLVDAVNFPKVIYTAKVCKRQIGVADIVVINKLDLVDTEQVEYVQRLIIEQKPNVTIYLTTYGNINSDWIVNMVCNSDAIEGYHLKDVSLQKYLITIKDSISRYQIIKFLEMFIESTYRIKGFVYIDGQMHLIDCSGIEVKVEPYTGEVSGLNKIVVLSGTGMDTQKLIQNAAKWYEQYIVSVE